MKALSALLCVSLLCVPSLGALTATADLTYSQADATHYNYSLNLHNTGNTNIGAFWYSWIPGLDFMAAPPTSVQSPTNWTYLVETSFYGSSIQWSTSGSPLLAGNSLNGFKFQSTLTPAQIAGYDPYFGYYLVNTSYVYIGVPEGDPGYQLTVQIVPEPSGLAGLGMVGGLLCILRRSKVART